MSKEYNIDDILSEVNKRREENEKKINSGESLVDDGKAEPENEPTCVETPVQEDNDEPVKEEIFEQKFVEEKDDELQEENEQKLEIVEEELPDEKENSPEENQPQEQEYVDLNSISFAESAEQDEYIEQEPEKKKMKKGKKAFISILCIILAVLIALGVGGYLYLDKILDRITPDSEPTQQTEEKWSGMDRLIENFEAIDETDASKISSLKDMIKQWYYNGTPCSSSHVLNIMLIGEDGYDPDEESRADSAIICSINIDTRKITLTSVLRDTYAYWENTEGDEQTGEFGKINGAKVNGIYTYISAIEHLYKIKINNYVTVDFESFKTIIDTLGGVDIEITSAEINEINNDQLTYDGTWIDKTFEGKVGVMRLDGQQALSYCRIRHLDSDNMRADRQKKCLNSIFESINGVSPVTLLKLLNNLTPYIKTDMSRESLMKIAKYALSEGWMDFDIVMNTVPNSRINERGAGGEYYGAWCWKSDFPQDAYNLQMRLYGKSSITLARTRVDVLKCRETGYYSQGSSPVYATIINEHYGEVTTLPIEETEESEE